MTGSVLIIVPAFNARPHLAELLEKVKWRLKDQVFHWSILVIDDGSSDHTAEMAESSGCVLIRHSKNLGKGASLKAGFAYAVENGLDVIVTIDADLQHDPASIMPMLELLNKEHYDVVIGSRAFDTGKMSPARIISNRITSALIAWRCGQTIPDSQSGYRVIRTDAIRDVSLKTSRYETESELLIRLCKNGCRIGFYPIETIYRNEKSHIRHFPDTIRFIRMFLSTK